MEKKQINAQDKIKIYSDMIAEAIQAADDAAEDLRASGCRAGTQERLNNAASAFNQVIRSNYMNAEIALWIDALVYNLPSAIVAYIQNVYGNETAYQTGNIK